MFKLLKFRTVVPDLFPFKRIFLTLFLPYKMFINKNRNYISKALCLQKKNRKMSGCLSVAMTGMRRKHIKYVLGITFISGILSPTKYRVIHKSLRDFRPLRYSSRDGHAEGEHVNRGRDTPNFCPTLQVLDMSTLGDAADVNPLIKFLPHTATCVAGT